MMLQGSPVLFSRRVRKLVKGSLNLIFYKSRTRVPYASDSVKCSVRNGYTTGVALHITFTIWVRRRGRSWPGPLRLLPPETGKLVLFMLQLAPAFEGAAERPLVGVLQVATNRQATCEARDFERQGLEFLLQIVGGVLAFKVRIGSQNHLAHGALLHTLQQFLDAQIFWPNAFDGRERAMQNMIQALIGACLLQGQHIQRLLDYADHLLVSVGIATYQAGINLGDVETARAIDDAFLHAHDRLGQTTRLIGGTAQKEEGEALGRFYAYPGQL